ncbi:MAG: hypothetical protein HON70_43650, partial [Lentisphaerae bacterium]|nr:hypothetical protein [Lentisphaerota bacterium]
MSDSNSNTENVETADTEDAVPRILPPSDTVPAVQKKPETPRYEPKQHIQPLDIAPRAEVLLDRREITIQSFQTTIPYDHDALGEGLEGAWLTPQVRFGVFSRERLLARDTASVVLGLQDEISVRAYDYDRRRPLWFSWQDVIVDTVGIRYVSDEHGLLCFRATGGGRRITDRMIHQFNSAHLHIPEATVTKRQFDLDKLREMCFGRFIDRLYMLRFSGPEAEEYRSIDHALFQSRQHIDPQAPRVLEVEADAEAKIESFDSDIEIACRDLVAPIRVRFFIRGTSGSLRLRFPKIEYRRQLTSTEEQARVAYQILDLTVNAILNDDYYAHQQPSLDDLGRIPQVMLPGLEDLRPYREAMSTPVTREEFVADLNVDDPHKQNWQPHLWVLNELLEADGVKAHVAELIGKLTVARPQRVVALLSICDADARMRRLGTVASRAAAAELQAAPAEWRPQVEEALLSWTLLHEEGSWSVNPETGEISTLNTLRWRAEDLSPDVFQRVVWKLVGVVHDRLSSASGDIAALLRQYHWCMEAAKTVSPQQSGIERALRFVAEGQVPRTPDDSAKLFKEPVPDLRALDSAVLDTYGLPLWPAFHAYRQDGKVVLSNVGVGSALALMAIPEGMLFVEADGGDLTDLLSGDSVPLPASKGLAAVDVQFEKL